MTGNYVIFPNDDDEESDDENMFNEEAMTDLLDGMTEDEIAELLAKARDDEEGITDEEEEMDSEGEVMGTLYPLVSMRSYRSRRGNDGRRRRSP